MLDELESRGPLASPFLPRRPTLESVRHIEADRLVVGRQIPAQPVGERGRVVGPGRHHDGQLARTSHEAGPVIVQ